MAAGEVFGGELALAHRLADAAEQIALPAFEAGRTATRAKGDGSPVTEADEAVEARMRALLADAAPGDAVLGEEGGGAAAALGPGQRRWVLDPIDGTRAFARANPTWGNLIALEDAGGVAVAVVNAPALRLRFWAVRGGGAWRAQGPGVAMRAGTALAVSARERLAGGAMSAGSLARLDDAGLRRVRALSRATGHHAGIADWWGFCLVAQGSLEAMAEPDLAWWDLAAPSLLVTEAGGRVTTWSGAAPTAAAPASVVATNGLVHAEALALLA